MIMLMEEDRRLGTSPNITQGDLAPDKMSSTKLKRVSVAHTTTAGGQWELQNYKQMNKLLLVNCYTCDSVR